MSLKYFLKKFRDAYVINQVTNIKLPCFEKSPIVRERLLFSGRVQKVGFRFETYELAKKLDLTGWVKNNIDKTVEAEIQGEAAKINFLINYMKSLKRASVHNVVINEIPILSQETDFVVIKETVSV